MNSSLILLPFLAVILLNLPLRPLMKKAALWVCLFVLSAQICYVIFPATYPWNNGLDIFGSFLKLHFTVDNLTRIMLFCIGVVLLVTLFVRRYVLKDDERLFNFINIVLLILIGMNGIVMVRDIFSLYVFMEITAVASFILIGYNKDLNAFEGAFKYIVMSVVATVLMLASIALLLMLTGDTGFMSLNQALKVSPDRLWINLSLGIFISACFIKSGLMPFHGWLPDAYSAAPASISVLLAGIVTKTVGVYTLIRVITAVFGFSNALKQVLLIVGAISIVAGALAALGQKNFKRMLAYSSISQVGYIVLGLGAGTALGLIGAIFHLFNHAMFKSLLFVNSAAVEHETGRIDIEHLSGIAKKMPVTGITSVLATLSASGIPPLAGFWSKLLIIMALWLAGLRIYAIVAVLASVLTLSYFLSLQRNVFFGKLREDLENIKEAGLGLSLPALTLAAIIVGVGVFFPYIINIFILPLGNILGG